MEINSGHENPFRITENKGKGRREATYREPRKTMGVTSKRTEGRGCGFLCNTEQVENEGSPTCLVQYCSSD